MDRNKLGTHTVEEIAAGGLPDPGARKGKPKTRPLLGLLAVFLLTALPLGIILASIAGVRIPWWPVILIAAIYWQIRGRR